MAIAAPAAPTPSSLSPACVPAAICMLYVCLHNKPVLGWTGQKNSMFHVIDTVKLEKIKLLWIFTPRLYILKEALSQRKENHGWPIYEGTSAVLLYCFV